MRPTQPHDSRHARLLGKQASGEVQQAPEIQSVRGEERLAVAREQPGNPWRRLGERRRHSAASAGVREQTFDQRKKTSPIRRHGLAVILQAGDRFIGQRDPVFSLRDQTEVGPQAQVASMLTKQVGGERVERAQVSTLRPSAKQSVYTGSHLGGGFRREGQSQDRRVVALLEYPDDPRGQHERLAGARSRQYEKRTVVPRHGVTLIRVEGIEVDRHHASRAKVTTRFSTPRISAVTPSSPRCSIAAATAAAARVLAFLGNALA